MLLGLLGEMKSCCGAWLCCSNIADSTCVIMVCREPEPLYQVAVACSSSILAAGKDAALPKPHTDVLWRALGFTAHDVTVLRQLSPALAACLQLLQRGKARACDGWCGAP